MKKSSNKNCMQQEDKKNRLNVLNILYLLLIFFNFGRSLGHRVHKKSWIGQDDKKSRQLLLDKQLAHFQT